MAYGYMRALDESLRRENPTSFEASSQSTEALAQSRLANYAPEQQVIDQMDGATDRIVRLEPAGHKPGAVVPPRG
jgi:hypothetical protein